MSRPAFVELDFAALCHNVKCIRKIAPQSKLLAMVKANAYGHGLVPVARAINHLVDGFGVTCVEEAIRLRQANITQRIVLMGGLFSASEVPLLDHYQLDVTLHSCQQLSMLTQQTLDKPVCVWVQINTGLNQLGLPCQDFPAFWEELQKYPHVQVVCVMTHFQSAYNPEDPATLEQKRQFQKFTQGLPVEKSLANSSGILAWSCCHADWIRPGLMLYGVSPFPNSSGVQYGLRPVMNLKSEIVAIQQLRAGDRLGYGGTWSAPDARRVGIVAMGYGDGYPHCAKNGTPVLVSGKLVELVGSVSMDVLTVDLGAEQDIKQGDPVCLWGTGLPIERVAKSTSSFRYELLCGINRDGLIRMHIEEKSNA